MSARKLSKSTLRYARNPRVRLQFVNYKRAKAGKPLLNSPEEIGRDFLAHCYSRRRDSRGRYI